MSPVNVVSCWCNDLTIKEGVGHMHNIMVLQGGYTKLLNLQVKNLKCEDTIIIYKTTIIRYTFCKQKFIVKCLFVITISDHLYVPEIFFVTNTSGSQASKCMNQHYTAIEVLIFLRWKYSP